MTDQTRLLLQQAGALHHQGRIDDAIAAYRKLLELRPDLADSWYDLAYLLKSKGQYKEALTAYETALAQNVSGPEEVYLNRAVIFADHLRRDDKAEAELRKSLQANPDYTPALLNLGNLFEEQGKRDEAAACYDRIVNRIVNSGGAAHETDPAYFEAMARLIHLRPPETVDDPALKRLEEASSGTNHLDPMTRSNMYFALGRSLDALKAYDRAFGAFAKANDFARQTGAAYNRVLMEKEIEALIDAFPDAAALAARAGKAGNGETGAETQPPIFICGMFRSGSTLAEQVLAAHPRVTAGGELNILHRLAGGALAPFPRSVKTADKRKFEALSTAYSTELARLFPEAGKSGQRVTDKRPDNFLLIGLIKKLLPAAQIVHTVRAPLDNGLSIYFQHLSQSPAPYSSSLEDIAHYYGQYRRLMDHWIALYPESIHEFDYDRFVRNPKPSLEALLKFLRLEWDDACLEHHRVANTVKTASYWQVRQPLYTKASGRAQNYKAHIEPLKKPLAAMGLIPSD